MRQRLALLALALAAAVPSAGAQSLSSLPRATVPTGLNDSTLVMVSDSARRTRAARALDFRKMLSLRAFDSLVTTNLRMTGGAITGSPTATFGAITVSSCTGCSAGVTYPLRADDGTAAAPSFSFSGATGMGLWRNATDLGVAVGGTNRVGVSSSGLSIESGKIFNQDGTAAAPTYTFNGQQKVGMYRRGLDTLGLAIGDSAGFWVGWDQNARFIRRTDRNTGVKFSYNAFVDGVNWYANGVNILEARAISGSTPVLMVKGTARSCDTNGNVHVRWSDIDSYAGIGAGADGTIICGAGDTTATFSGTSGTIVWRGGGGNLAINAGTGNNRALTLQTTGAAGATQSQLTLNANQTSTFSGSVGVGAGTVSIPGLNNAGGSTGVYWLGADTLAIAASGASVVKFCCSGGAGPAMIGPNAGAGSSFTIRAGAGTSARLVLQTTTSGGTATTALRFNEAQQSLFASGGVNQPSLSFLADTTRGWYRGASSGEWFFSDAGTQLLQIGGTATDQFHVMRFGSAAAPALALGGLDNGFFVNSNGAAADTVFLSTNGVSRLAVADMAATAAGDVNLCWNATSKIVRQGATCGSSTAKTKTGFASILSPSSKTLALRPVFYAYQPEFYGGRAEYGLVAEEVAAVDSTLVFRAERDETLANGQRIRKGDPINVNDRAVLALLLAEVQQLRRQVDSLRAVRKP